jgi:hypothetical protein
MNIYFRFYYYDFLDKLKESFENDDRSDRLKSVIAEVIKNQPFEFYKSCQEYTPKWLLFFIMDVFYDKDLLPNMEDKALDDQTFRNYEYVEFLNYLIHIDVDFVDFLNFSTFYNSSDDPRSFLKLLEIIVMKFIIKSFSIYEKNPTKDNKNILTKKLELVFKEILNIQGAEFIHNSVSKVS